MTDAEEWVLSMLREHCDPGGEGHNVYGDVWTSKTWVEDQTHKTDEFEKDETMAALERLIDRDDVLNWHGLVVPAEAEYLRAVNREEVQCERVRKLLVGEANKLSA